MSRDAAFAVAMVDVDGTLRDSSGWLPGAPDLLDALADAGLSVALCSGRPVHSMESLVADLPMVTHLSGAGGSVVERREPDGSWRVLLARTLTPADVDAVTAACADADVEVWAYTADQWLVTASTERTERETRIIGHEPTVVETLAGRDDVLKLLTLPADEDRLAQVDRAAARGEGLAVVSSSSGYHDVIPAASLATKGGDALVTDLGIGWSQVVAIGDGPNDVGMVGLAGLGVCLPDLTPDAVAASNPALRHRTVAARDRYDVVEHLGEWLSGR